jgi:hypothetical protein
VLPPLLRGRSARHPMRRRESSGRTVRRAAQPVTGRVRRHVTRMPSPRPGSSSRSGDRGRCPGSLRRGRSATPGDPPRETPPEAARRPLSITPRRR